MVVIVLVSLWAGYGVFRLAHPRIPQFDVATGAFVFGLTGVLGLGWLALLAAELGVFSAHAVMVMGVVLGAAGWLAARRRGGRTESTEGRLPRAEAIVLIGLVALTGVLYLRPHEFIFGGADAGVYVNLGASVSRSGGWLLSNPDLSALPADDDPMLFRAHPSGLIPRYYHLPGFYVDDDDAGRITPQFYPLHPIWLALAHGLGGLADTLLMTPVWGMLGVMAVYFAVRETFDWRIAAIAAALLALTPTQIWFARYPTAEVLTQFLLFGGLYAFARHVRTSEAWAAVLAGLALGQVMLVRIDMYFLLAAPIVYAAYLRFRRRLDRRFWFFALPMSIMALHSLIHAVWQGWPYFYNTYVVSRLLPISPGLLVIAAPATLAAFVIADRVVARRPGWASHIQPAWHSMLGVCAVGLVLLGLYAYFLRPLQADPAAQGLYWYGGNTVPDVEPYNLVRLGWYLSPLGLALGVLGMALIVGGEVSERSWLLIGSGVFFTLLYVYRSFNNPHHVYVMRRYVPAVIPMFALSVAYVLNALAARQTLGRVLAAGLGLAQIGLMLYAGRLMIGQVDYRGGVDQYRDFARSIPRSAIVLFNDNQPVGTAGIVGTPLAYIDGYTVFDLQEDLIDLGRLDALVGGWLASGRPVVVVDGPSRVSGLCDRWLCRPIGRAPFDMPLLEASYEYFPTAITPMQFSLDVYQVDSVLSGSGASSESRQIR